MSKKRTVTTDPTQDPFREREEQKYENPVPSREFLMDQLAESAKPLTRNELADILDIRDPDAQEGLRRRLIAMTRDGQVICNRRKAYVLVDNKELVRGRVMGRADGDGYLTPDVGGAKIHLSPAQMRSLLHGDRAVVRITGVDAQGAPEGELVDVIERQNRTVVGRFFRESGVGFVVPSNRRIHQDVIVPAAGQGEAADGDLVVVELARQPEPRRQPIGRVLEVLGAHIEPGMEIDTAARVHGIPVEWPDEVAREVMHFSDHVPDAAKEGRVDLRDTALVTIDGADARDFDDAVFCEATASGWRLLVAIADVSHYVQPRSALDREARERGNSVYFPRNVVPMLPEVLSNGLCSLNPHVDRLCMVCEMQITKSGQIRGSKFYQAVMNSHQRFIYEDVAAMLVDGDKALRKTHKKLVPHLEHLYEAYQALLKARKQRGAIDFETTETRINFDPTGQVIESIEPTERTEAHKVIEECMISANVATARFLEKHRILGLFRNHEGPSEEKLDNLRQFLGEIGLQLGGGDSPSAKDYARVLERAHERPDRHMIASIMLRSLRQAVYAPKNEGHFGLSLEEYAHFTSPIRRYPDLLVHRAIRHILNGGTGRDYRVGYDEMLALGEHCSMTERRADEATRDAVMTLKCQYMRDHLGGEFDAIVTGVTGFGLFVELQDVYVEGLIHVTQLENDFFHFDPIGHRLSGERSGKEYRLTDRVRVKVARVDVDDRKIDLALIGSLDQNGELIEGGADGAPRPARKGSRTGSRRRGAGKRRR